MTPLLLWLGCAGAPDGTDQPIQVRGATYFEGELPVDEGAATPLVSYAASSGFIITQGQASVSFSGAASPDTWSIAAAFPGAEGTSGYWVVPVGAPDPTQDGLLTFKLTVDFARDVPYGLQDLRFVALDERGNPSPAYDATLCVLPEYADGNLAACEASIAPQHTLVSLSWDTDVDLDLTVVTPSGRVVNGKTPATAEPDEDGTISSEALADPSTGVVSRDSNAACDIDRINLESLVFAGEPAPGDYAVYADLWSACDARSVRLSLDLYQREDLDDGTWTLTPTHLADGLLLSSQADAGQRLGTYLTTVSFP